MLRFRNTLIALAAVLLASCGGGSDNTIVGTGAGVGGAPAVDVGSLTLISSQATIQGDGSDSATITAIVRDVNNNTVQGVPVVFSATSGSLTVSNPAVSGADGTVTAALSTPTDLQNRTITVTAAADDLSDTVDVQVVGTILNISGPTSLALGDVGTYNVVLSDAAGNGISGEAVDITSSGGNAVSATPLTTDATGQASFMLTANASGSDTLTASALGISASTTVTVSADVFSFTAPAVATEIPLGTPQTFTVQWLVGGAAVTDGSQINFSSTRGTVSASSATTTGGTASITVTATNAGPAVVTATNTDGTSTQIEVEFIATAPAEVELQANPFTIGPQESSALTAIVRDAAGNLVKNQTVTFTLTDVTGGSLTVAQGITNSQGRVQSFYTASSQTSASEGVSITATVQGTAFSDSVALTVAQRELFISIGTGNEIFEPNTAQYRKEWVIQVTDSQGNGVEGVNVSLSILSERYWEGVRRQGATAWETIRGIDALPLLGCPDEDINRNGILDPGEDLNANLRIEAGNIAAAVAQGSGGSTVVTDVNGFALVDVFWPQEYALWVEVTLEAKTSVEGTEFAESTTFMLSISAGDVTNLDAEPPGFFSPFGTDGICATPPPPDGP